MSNLAHTHNHKKIIHVGYSKCASTYLQKKLFPEHEDIFLYGKNLSGQGEKFPGLSGELTRDLINLECFRGLTDQYLDDINYHMEQNKNKTFVWSNEHFCESVAPLFLAQNFKALIPDAEILVIIRKQTDIVKSMYNFKAYHLEFSPQPYKNKHIKFSDWIAYCYKNLNTIGGHKARDWSGDYLRIIHYDDYIRILESVFEPKNIHIIPFERLIKDFKEVYQVIGVTEKIIENKPENKSQQNHFAHQVASALGLKRGLGLGLSKWLPKPNKQFDQASLDLVFNTYKASNQQLDERYQLGLQQLGYY